MHKPGSQAPTMDRLTCSLGISVSCTTMCRIFSASYYCISFSAVHQLKHGMAATFYSIDLNIRARAGAMTLRAQGEQGFLPSFLPPFFPSLSGTDKGLYRRRPIAQAKGDGHAVSPRLSPEHQSTDIVAYLHKSVCVDSPLLLTATPSGHHVLD